MRLIVEGAVSLCEETRDESSERVPGAGGSECRVPGWVHEHAAVGRRNDRARAFEHEYQFVSGCETTRRCNASGKSSFVVGADESQHLARMRRENQRMLCRANKVFRPWREGVQSVGVYDAGFIA